MADTGRGHYYGRSKSEIADSRISDDAERDDQHRSEHAASMGSTQRRSGASPWTQDIRYEGLPPPLRLNFRDSADADGEILRLMMAQAEYGSYEGSSSSSRSMPPSAVPSGVVLSSEEEELYAPPFGREHPSARQGPSFQGQHQYISEFDPRTAPPPRNTSTLASSMIMPWLSEANESSHEARSNLESSSLYPSSASSSSASPLLAVAQRQGTNRPTLSTSKGTSQPSSSSTSLSRSMSSAPDFGPTPAIATREGGIDTRRRSGSGADEVPACDLCRKRKVKCDRQQPTCSPCARQGLECTTNDQLRRRGPPTKAHRSEMSKAGFVYDRGKRQWRPARPEETASLEEGGSEDSRDSAPRAPTKKSHSTSRTV